MNASLKWPLLTAAVLVFLDQWLKLWIKTSFALGESLPITSWFQFHFTENPGMAFGMEWGGIAGKYALSSFRILAIGGILWYMRRLAQGGATAFCPDRLWHRARRRHGQCGRQLVLRAPV